MIVWRYEWCGAVPVVGVRRQEHVVGAVHAREQHRQRQQQRQARLPAAPAARALRVARARHRSPDYRAPQGFDLLRVPVASRPRTALLSHDHRIRCIYKALG